MKNKKILKVTIFLFPGAVLTILCLISFYVFELWHRNTYKTELQTIKMPERNIKFILLTDMSGFDDISWYVYKISVDKNLSAAQKKSGETNDVLFWNYSEAGEHQENPFIRITKGKYLIFSRGNLDYSLYDIDQDKVIVNEHSAWGAVAKKSTIDLPIQETDQLMNEWVLKNVHTKISNYIK